jgi:hypothetical protein
MTTGKTTIGSRASPGPGSKTVITKTVTTAPRTAMTESMAAPGKTTYVAPKAASPAPQPHRSTQTETKVAAPSRTSHTETRAAPAAPSTHRTTHHTTTTHHTASKAAAPPAKPSKPASHRASHAETDTSSKTTTDHEVIRKWAEKRGGHPTSVTGTEHGKESAGVLRLDFGVKDEKLHAVDWNAFFDKFEEAKLTFLHQDKTSNGKLSRFHKFIHRH